jgi:hypothetical protein
VVDVCQIQASEWMPLTRATHSGTFSDETSLSVVASKARWHPFYGGVTCVNDDATIKLQWVFFYLLHLFFLLSLPKYEVVLSFIFYIKFGSYSFDCYLFCFLSFFYWFFSFNIVLVIWFDLIWFSYQIWYLFFWFLNSFTNWILCSILSLNIWF